MAASSNAREWLRALRHERYTQNKSAGLADTALASLLKLRSAASERKRYRLAALGRVDDAHVDLLAFGEVRNAGRPEDRDVNEHVLAAVIARDEAEPLGVVEPLHLPGDRNCGRRIWRNPPSGRSLRPLDDAGRVHLQNPRHLRAFRAGADQHLELGAGRNRFMA